MKPLVSDDLRFALMVVFGGSAVVAITPFTVYRFASGHVAGGVIDLLIQLAILAIVLYAWRSGKTDRAGVLIALATSAGSVAVSLVSGLAGTFWLYPVLTSNFLLAGRGAAVLISSLAILVVVSSGALEGTLVTASFAASAGVLCMFAWLFAAHSEKQRARLERLAGRDPLTGAANRRGMQRELQEAVDAHARNVPAALAVLDLDEFKQVNDRHGHEAGDAVLVEFAELVRRSTRSADRLFRTGGEEFVLLLPGADGASLERVARIIRRAVRSRIRCGGEPITVSIGGTPLRAGDDVERWLHRADQAMYRAKREGRDRVVVDREPDGPPDAGPPGSQGA